MSKNIWLEYGEPMDNGKVQATMTVEQEYPDTTERREYAGTLEMSALSVWEDSEHAHDDGSLLLSACDMETRDYLEDRFKANKPTKVEGVGNED